MDIFKKIAELKQSILKTDNLIEKMLLNLKTQKIENKNKENRILNLKEKIRNNVEKIDKIIENYNAKN